MLLLGNMEKSWKEYLCCSETWRNRGMNTCVIVRKHGESVE